MYKKQKKKVKGKCVFLCEIWIGKAKTHHRNNGEYYWNLQIKSQTH